MHTLRIFVSSPGDVRPERVRAYGVIQRLQTKFRAFIKLEPILWEHEAMRGTASFQAQILPPSKTDIVICILWARIGKRLPQNFQRPDGTIPTGTEWEFEDANAAHAAHGVPDLYVYRKTATPTVEIRSREEQADWDEQKKALDGFLERWFFDHDGSFKAAFNPFETDQEFEMLLTRHLEKIIGEIVRAQESVIENEKEITWFEGSPFRGLQVFQREHAPIFFGRDLVIQEVVERLTAQASAGRVFLMIVGASGSGKSSLARAGLLPALLHPGTVDGVDGWRWLILRPGETSPNLVHGLAAALQGVTALPEIAAAGHTVEILANRLRESAASAIPFVQAALTEAAAKQAGGKQQTPGPVMRLIVIIDQLEEIFTPDRIGAPERASFLDALAALSQSGLAWVMTTMRSDLYGHCVRSETLLALKGTDGQYDLTAPSFTELAQIIRRPARAAGLTYALDPIVNSKLDDALLSEAVKNPESLPLLQFTLDQLYKTDERTAVEAGQGDTWNRVLTWKSYRKIGGLEGAITQRADDEYAQLSVKARAALPFVFGRLVTLGSGTVNAQQARRDDFSATVGAEEVVAHFTAANLFISSADPGGEPVIALAHEALLRRWTRLRKWVEDNKAFLETRQQIDSEMSEWEKHGRRGAYLLRPGPRLKSARKILRRQRRDLSRNEIVFIRRSSRRNFLRSWAGRLSILVVTVLGVIATLVGALLAQVNGNGENPSTYCAVLRDYASGIVQASLGRKAEAIANFQKGLAASAGLKLPPSVRGLDVGFSIEMLKLVNDTNAAMPDDSMLQNVHEWAEICAAASGTSNDEIVTDLHQQTVNLLEKRERWSDAAKYGDFYIEWLRKKVRDFPHDTALQDDLGGSLRRAGQAHLSAGHLQPAQLDFTDALRLAASAPPSGSQEDKAGFMDKLANLHFLSGQTAMRQRDYAAAAAQFSEAVQTLRALLAGHAGPPLPRRPHLMQSLDSLGVAQAYLDHWPEANRAADDAAALARENLAASPNDQTIRGNCMRALSDAAWVYESQIANAELLSKAVGYYEEVLAIAPTNVDACATRGYLQAELGHKAAALADFHRAVELDPKNARTFENFGWAWVLLDDPREALEPWTACLRLNESTPPPRSADSLLVAAASAWISEDMPQAIKAYQDLVKLDPAWQRPQTVKDQNWPGPRKALVESICQAAVPAAL